MSFICFELTLVCGVRCRLKLVLFIVLKHYLLKRLSFTIELILHFCKK